MGIKCGSGDQLHLRPPVLRVSQYSAEESKGEELKRARRGKANTCIEKGEGTRDRVWWSTPLISGRDRWISVSSRIA